MWQSFRSALSIPSHATLSAPARELILCRRTHPDLDGPDRFRMGSTMAKPSRGRRPFSLEVGFEGGRGGRDALGRAYERLLPLLARSLPPSPQATLAKGAHHESPASQSSPSSRGSAGGPLRSCLVRSAG